MGMRKNIWSGIQTPDLYFPLTYNLLAMQGSGAPAYTEGGAGATPVFTSLIDSAHTGLTGVMLDSGDDGLITIAGDFYRPDEGTMMYFGCYNRGLDTARHDHITLCPALDAEAGSYISFYTIESILKGNIRSQYIDMNLDSSALSGGRRQVAS